MKKTLLSILFSFLVFAIFAQDIIYTVSGELNGEKVPLDSILIENLTSNTWISFKDIPNELYYQINLTKKAYWGTTGISDIQNNMSGFVESQNMLGEITLTYNNTVPTPARFSVYNLKGQVIYSSSKQTIIPGNSIQVKLAETGVYLVRVESDLGTQSFRGIGLPSASNYDISVQDQANFDVQAKSGQITFESDFEYSMGDSIRISVYKKDNYARPIGKNILNSENINFLFKISEVTTSGISDAYVELNENTASISSYNTENGQTVITYSGEKPQLNSGDIITVDMDTMGYLRKVVKVFEEDGSLKVETELADLSDIFVDKEIKLDTELLDPGVTLKSNSSSSEISKALTDENGYIHPLEIIYHDKSGDRFTKSALNLKSTNGEKVSLFDINENFSQDIFKNGNIHFYVDKGINQLKGDAVFEFFFDYKGDYNQDTKVKQGELVAFSYFLKTTYELSSTIRLDMTAEDEKEGTKKLLDFKQVTAKFLVGTVPVWITFDVDVFGKYSIKADAAVNADWGFQYLASSTAGGAYSGENDQFSPIKRFDFTETFTPLNIEGTLNVTSRFEVYPKIDVLFYSFIGPVIELAPYVTGEIHAKAQTQITTTETKNFFAWNSGMNLGFDLRTGLKLSFAGLGEKTLGPYEFPIYNTQVWNAPDSLILLTTLPDEATSGDTIDLQFGVMDNLKNYVAACPIYIEGDGEFSDELFLTDTSGTNNIKWIIPEDGDGVVKFTSSIFDVDKNVVSEVSKSVDFSQSDTLSNNYRLKEYKGYSDGQLDFILNLSYEGEQVAKWEEYDLEDGDEYNYEFLYDGDLLTILFGGDKITYLIENGLTKEIKYYERSGGDSWVLTGKDWYQYSGTNIVLSNYEDYSDGQAYKSKGQYIYDDNNLIQINSHSWEDGNWENSWKDVLSYSGDKLVKLTSYSYYDNAWNNSYKEEFSYSGDQMTSATQYDWNRDSWAWEQYDITTINYDTNGNVSEMVGEDWKNEFVYEKGKGNLSNILIEDYDEFYGLKVFKSVNIQKESIHKLHASLYNRLKNKYPFVIK